MESASASADRDESSGERKSKRRKLNNPSPLLPPPPAPSRWTTEPEQRAYSTRLLEALRRVRGRAAASASASAAAPSSSSASPPLPHPPVAPRSRAVRDAADRVLAFAARGRTRWSRAILLSTRVRIRAARLRPKRPAPPQISPALKAAAAATSAREKQRRDRSNSSSNTGGGSSSSSGNNREGDAPALQRKAKVLGSLVPGCRKLPLSTLLDETSDYIAALQMQVRAMSALAEVLSSSSAAGSSSSSSQAVLAPSPDRPGYPPYPRGR